MAFLSHLLAKSLPLFPRPLVGWAAKRYVAGADLDAVERSVEELNQEGAVATVALLGEEVTTRQAAGQAVAEYVRLLERIASAELDATLSVKLTLLGLRLDEDLCRENLEQVARKAAEAGNFVRLDMEDHTVTDATLCLYRQAQERHGNLGVVLQAYLRRTLADIDSLPRNANVRLCKGIYVEPREVAWQGYDTVRRNFLEALERLFERGAYVGIATHDEYLLCAAEGMLKRYGLRHDRYEFQMLLGVLPAVRQILIGEGHPVRVYVPYGHDWYAYSLRRLRENPRIAVHVLRAILGRE